VKKNNVVESGRPQMTIWRMRVTCWLPKATNTHSEYVFAYCFSTARIVKRPRHDITFILGYIFSLFLVFK